MMLLSSLRGSTCTKLAKKILPTSQYDKIVALGQRERAYRFLSVECKFTAVPISFQAPDLLADVHCVAYFEMHAIACQGWLPGCRIFRSARREIDFHRKSSAS